MCVGGPFLMRVTLFGKLDGWHGTLRTVREMEKLVDEGKKDPTVQFTARQIARKFHSKDYVGQANGLHEFVRDYIHYVRDPIDVELIHAPLFTLKARAGDCDDQAILLRALAESIGFNSRFKTIKADKKFPNEYSHIYSEIEVPGKGWMPSDTIVEGKKLGWEAGAQYPSRTWGGLGMFGEEAAASGTQLNFWGKLAQGFQNSASSIGNVLGQAAAQYAGQQLNVPTTGTTTPTIASPSDKSWLGPVAFATLALGGVGLFLWKPWRKRRSSPAA